MVPRKTPGIDAALLVIGLAVSVIGLMAATIPFADPGAVVGSILSARSARPVTAASAMASSDRSDGDAAPVPVSPDPGREIPSWPSGRIVVRKERGGQDDARIDLQVAAAMARRYPGAGRWRGETRTDLWINAPASIHSMSPPPASPVISPLPE
jgi:hypothetical protein